MTLIVPGPDGAGQRPDLAPVLAPDRAPRSAGIGEALVGRAGEARLAAFGLGSCVGLTVWDPVTRIGGLAHFMLPAGARAGNPVKYIDTGLAWFLAFLADAGLAPRRSRFKAAGGAAMFLGVSGNLEVGRRNAAALTEGLTALGLRLTAHEMGGTVGRSIELDLATGSLSIRTIHGTSTL
jgi:chemotaxis protein CheD